MRRCVAYVCYNNLACFDEAVACLFPSPLLLSPAFLTTENPRVRKSGVMDGGVRSSVLGGELW